MACALAIAACGSSEGGGADDGDDGGNGRPRPSSPSVVDPQVPLTSDGGAKANRDVATEPIDPSPDAGHDAQGDSEVDARVDASGQIRDASAEASDSAVDQSSPFPCSDNGRFTVVGITAVDSSTGLTWERATSALVSLGEAVRRCENLGAGWRVPSISELQSIHRVAPGCIPEIDWSAFPSTPHASTNQEDDSFWSSTPDTRPAVPANAYSTLHFGTGVVSYAVTTARTRVKCVR